MSYETVEWEVRDGVGHLTLNRPETINAWNFTFGKELVDVLSQQATKAEVRAVVIRGAGRGFSSGADLSGNGLSPAEDGRPDILYALHQVYHPVLRWVRKLEKPVIASVHGACVGIGMSLAVSCDLVLAAESSFFSLAFAGIGLMPDGGSTLFVPAAIGKARAFEMALLGDRVPAPKALDWGLINAVHPDDDLATATDTLAARLAVGPTRSYAGTKRALNASIFGHMEAQFDLEADIQHSLARSEDFLEGATAFLEKRDPTFSGR